MVELRPYQEKNFSELREQLRSYRSVIYVLPCGGGKGTVVAKMVSNAVARGKHVTFAVKGLALVNDMSRRLTRLGVAHGVLRGGVRIERWHQVQVASIDTLFRMDPKPPADLIIIDEARTFMSPTGRAAIDEYPNAKIVGMDATPARLDGKGLGVASGGLFESIVTGPDEQELIDLGFLCPSLVMGTAEPPDVDRVKKTGGDFNKKKLAEVCDRVKLVGDIVEHWLRVASDLKTIAFGVDQKHAQHIRDSFVAAGVEWEYVDAATPDVEREAIYERLDNGTLMGISNCLIAGVGWDHPIVSCIIAARPTASLELWRQMMGRGSRIYPGKKRFLILDHAQNSVRHWPYGFFETPPIWTLNGPEAPPGMKKGRAMSQCKKPVPVPPTGVPASFTGPVSEDGKFMLPSYHYFFSGPSACPYCGLPLLKNLKKQIETEAGELVDLAAMRDAAKVAALADSATRQAHEDKMHLRYMELARQGRNGITAAGQPYKSGWAAIQFRLEFHRWPMTAWKKEAEAEAGERSLAQEAMI